MLYALNQKLSLKKCFISLFKKLPNLELFISHFSSSVFFFYMGLEVAFLQSCLFYMASAIALVTILYYSVKKIKNWKIP